MTTSSAQQSHVRRHPLALSVLLLVACGGDDPSSPAPIASQLAFLSQPGPVEAGEAIDPAVTVEVHDDSGRRVADAVIGITLALGQKPDGAALSGTKTVRSVGGVASFSGLSLDSAATGYTLTARASNLAGAETSLFEVVPGPAATLEVSPASARLNAIGDALQLDATVRDRVGNAVPGVGLTWSSADPDVATVDEEGRVVSVAEGDVAITAEGAGFEGQMTLKVEQVAATVAVSPAVDTLAEGETVELRAVAADSNGVELSDVEITWESEAPAVAAVTSTGPDAAAIEALRGGPTRITASMAGQSAAAEIIVLRKIVFVQRSGGFSLRVMNEDGTGETRLLISTTIGSLSWSPDGAVIAFWSTHAGSSEIYTMRTDGSGPTNLTTHRASDSGPAWSPDGSEIAFISARDDNFEIYRMKADGSAQTRLTNNATRDFRPVWSPDGNKIAFQSNIDGVNTISVMNADGSDPLTLTSTAANNNAPRWSVDGRRIVFWSDRDGNSEIYLMNADGTDQTNLTNSDGADLGPVWSPDGRRIAFWSSRDGNGEIYVMNADGSGQTNLTNLDGADLRPVWSPDGQRIAFTRYADGSRSDLYVMNADGSGQRRLTKLEALAFPELAWRPDPLP